MPIVTNATVKVNTFKTVFTDIVTTSKSSTWSVVASYPHASPSFPCIVVNPAKVSPMGQTFRSSGRKYEVVIEIEFYARASSHRIADVDAEIDKIREGFFTLETTLQTNFLTLANNPIDEMESSTLYIGDEKFHYGSIIVYMRKI